MKKHVFFIVLSTMVANCFGQTLNYVAKFDASSTPVNSSIFDNGGKVGIGTTTLSSTFNVFETNPTGGAMNDILNLGFSNYGGQVGDAMRINFAQFTDISTYFPASGQIGFSFHTWIGAKRESIVFSPEGALMVNTPTHGNHLAVFNTVGHGMLPEGVLIKGYDATAGWNALKVENSGGSPLLYVRNDGNVGIGIANPTASLEVAGQVKITGGSPGVGKVLTSDNDGLGTWSDLPANTDWSLNGNSSTIDGTNFIGTTDDVPFNVRVNNQNAGRIDATSNNTFWGYQSGNANSTSSSTGIRNTATGYQSLYSNDDGIMNTAFGMSALYSNVSGNYNTATGFNALASSTGSDNTAMGQGVMQYTTSSGNTAIGSSALYSNTIGDKNTAVGFQAGYTALPTNANVSGSGNTFIGYNSGPGSSDVINNATAIGYNAVVSQSNSLVLGGTEADAVNVGIGIINPAYALDILTNSTAVIQIGHTSETGFSSVLFSNLLHHDAAEIFLNGSSNTSYAGSNSLNIYSGIYNLGFHTGSVENAMTLIQNGNVGIGTTTPGSFLHIEKDATGDQRTFIRLNNINTSTTTSTEIELTGGANTDEITSLNHYPAEYTADANWTNSGMVYSNAANGLILNSPAGPLRIFNNGTEKMRVLTSGNVGIGTSTPASRLEVNASENYNFAAKIYNGGGSGYGLLIKSGAGSTAGPGLIVQDGYGTEYFRVNCTSNGGDNMGRVGILAPNPEAQLHVESSGSDWIAKFHGGAGNAKGVWIRSGAGSSAGPALWVQDDYGNDLFKVNSNTGTCYAQDLIIQASPFPDYVFDPNYQLISLDSLENYIHTNKHLPNMESAKVVDENGASMSNTLVGLTQNTEELTLYMIEMNKNMIEMNKKMKQLEELNLMLEKELKEIKEQK